MTIGQEYQVKVVAQMKAKKSIKKSKFSTISRWSLESKSVVNVFGGLVPHVSCFLNATHFFLR
ncbi:uncharacterized protein PHALS_15095 [Plasmopara halstedii]|uniref:Uncharacterized protein n=1 Tax=Plasmopara halstedii TaxID=4781 RepID=A0A0P1B3A2_PLAHL|nr:uncharacterized protein PHALS_15095 [Plasmopara halstedii]CEG48017.1 hypothetical protein PHALS_15095 [Plasmopara halstedii]|eukprot:XP_024584386.1 hypothetical protein PHALS_15095 [Plasmopara halstedii]